MRYPAILLSALLLASGSAFAKDVLVCRLFDTAGGGHILVSLQADWDQTSQDVKDVGASQGRFDFSLELQAVCAPWGPATRNGECFETDANAVIQVTDAKSGLSVLQATVELGQRDRLGRIPLRGMTLSNRQAGLSIACNVSDPDRPAPPHPL